jgi:hypothetical protein
MKLLTRCDHPLQAAHLANALRAAGIACEVRNTTLAGAVGDIPWLECAPQIWLEREADEARAQALLEELRRPVSGPAWTCATCGETLEPQFAACWRCGSLRGSGA